MDITITPKKLSGHVSAIPSKSQAHRLLICSAFADRETTLICPESNQDIEATADCLRALGAKIHRADGSYHIQPIRNFPKVAEMDCRESGSTLRFLLPIVGALGVDTTFHMAGRLPQRPLSPLWELMESMGCRLSRPTADTLQCQGKLRVGHYQIDGGVSSQFITGLMFAHSLMDGKSTLEITGKIESKPYIEMTRNALALFHAPHYHSPGNILVEGDWSNAAFWLTATALGSNVIIDNLSKDSPQGDRAISELLPQLITHKPTICVADIPDLVPILAVAATAKHGAVFTDIARLRLKESDRVASTVSMIVALGGKAEASENSLTVFPANLTGGTVDSCNDHRIAMAAAIASTVCKEQVRILGAECVKKSYPKFWEDFSLLGGNYEQYLR